MEDLEIKCLNYNEGCEWEGTLNELEEHLEKQCLNINIKCINEKCNEVIKRKELQKHLDEDCKFQKIACRFESIGCNDRIERQNMTIHLIEKHQDDILKILEEKKLSENQLKQINSYQQDIEKLQEENLKIKNQYEEMFNLLTGEKEVLIIENENLVQNQEKFELQITEFSNQRKELEQEINSLQEQIKQLQAQQEESKNKQQKESSFFDYSGISNLKPSIFDIPENQQDSQIKQDNNITENSIKSKNSYNTQNQTPNNTPATGPPELTSFEKYQEALNRRIKEQLERENKQFPIQQSLNLQQQTNQMQQYQQQNNYGTNITQISQSVAQPKYFQAQFQQQQQAYQQQLDWIDLQGHSNTITSLISLPRLNNHDLIVSVSEDKMLRVWDLGSLSCVQILSGHTGSINDVCFVESKHLLITVSSDFSLRIWEMQTGKCKKIIHGKCALTKIIFFKQHQVAVVSGDDKKLRVISPDDNNFREELCSLYQEVTCISSNTSMKENQIAAGDKGGKLYVIEPDFEQKKSRIIGLFASKIMKERKGHAFQVGGVEMVKKMRMVLSCAFEEQYLKVWF